jgi:hypothetical protein
MQKNFHVEKERAIFYVITITIDAAIDAVSRVGNLTLIVVSMRPGDKPRPHLVQAERRKRLAWSIRKQVGTNNGHFPAQNIH